MTPRASPRLRASSTQRRPWTGRPATVPGKRSSDADAASIDAAGDPDGLATASAGGLGAGERGGSGAGPRTPTATTTANSTTGTASAAARTRRRGRPRGPSDAGWTITREQYAGRAEPAAGRQVWAGCALVR